MDIESAYQKSVSIVNLSKCSSQLPYTINFTNMNQTRHHYNTKRDIKRVPLSPGHSLQSLLKAGSSPPGYTSMPTAAPLGLTGATALSHPSVMNAHSSGTSASAYSIPHPTATHSFGPAPTSALGTSHVGHVPTASHGLYSHPLTTVAPTHASVYPNYSTPHHTGAMANLTPFSFATTTSQSASVTTRSKSKSVATATKTSKSTSSSATTAPKKSAAVPATSKSTKGKARARTKKKNTVETMSHQAVGVASSPDDILSAYARKISKLKPKHDEVSPPSYKHD